MMTLELVLASEAVVPGDSIITHVVVGGEHDARLQGCRIELAYENRYCKREYRSSSSSSSFSSSGSWEEVIRAEKVVVATVPIGLGGVVTPATYDVALTLPPDAPASVDEWVEWSVTAVLDRRRARDRKKTVPLTVRTGPSHHAAQAAGQKVSGTGCDMSLELPTRTLGVGEGLAGVLHIVPTSRFEARRVRVQLEHRMHHEDDIVRALGKEEAVLAGKTTFIPGEALRLPFEVGVPIDGIPSLRTRRNEVRWCLTGICDRRLRGDNSVGTEIEVYNAPPQLRPVAPSPAFRSPADPS